jgi:hypothetical protein
MNPRERDAASLEKLSRKPARNFDRGARGALEKRKTQKDVD